MKLLKWLALTDDSRRSSSLGFLIEVFFSRLFCHGKCLAVFFSFICLGSIAHTNPRAATPATALSLLPSTVVHVAPMQINGLASFQGRYLTVYYAVSVPTWIVSHEAQPISLALVRSRFEGLRIDADVLNLPGVSLQRTSEDSSSTGDRRPHYNRIVFVVHSQPNFVWRNNAVPVARGFVPSIPPSLTDPGPDAPVEWFKALAVYSLDQESIATLGGETRTFEGEQAPTLDTLVLSLSRVPRFPLQWKIEAAVGE